jgi:broad specificity phosphatase PhoE
MTDTANLTTTILLLRHGQNDAVGIRLAGREAVPLNDAGLEQARRLVARLAGVRIDAIYSSPLLRTRQTAEPLAEARGLEVRDMPGAVEFNMGEFDGRRFDELKQDRGWQRFNEQRSLARGLGGESMLEVQARFVGDLLQAAVRHAGGTFAVFSHADLIRAAVMYFAGMPIDFFHRLDLAPASLCAVALRPGGPALLKVNDTGDLQGLPNF